MAERPERVARVVAEIPTPPVPEVVRPPLLTLEGLADQVDRLWDKVTELQDITDDLNTRMIDVEHFLARLALPTAEVTLPREELERLIPPEIRGSRWVLEIFPDEVEEWRRAIRTIPTEKLTERERSFLRALDYYIVSERKITIPQLAWLRAIQQRAGGVTPTVPMPAASSSHSNPNQRRYGAPKTDVERIMTHYGVSMEEAERLIRDVMRVYGISREEAVKVLLPPRGAKVKAGSSSSNIKAERCIHGYLKNLCPECKRKPKV
ncbi:MAG: hypothetical protein ACPL1Z_05825 [Candidatus Bathyarchaeales archaeon]